MTNLQLLSTIFGVSEDEVAWCWQRIHELIVNQGKTKEEAMEIILRETKEKPWETPE